MDHDTVIDRVVQIVNDFIRASPQAATEMFNHEIPCAGLDDHPAIQVRAPEHGGSFITALGLLSGIAGAWPNGYSRVAVGFEAVCVQCHRACEVHQVDGAPVSQCCDGSTRLGRAVRMERTKDPDKLGTAG